MRKFWKRLFLFFLFCVFAIQLIRPAKTNPPIDRAREITGIHPASVEAALVLQRSCNDCHSNRTAWPWYSHMAPASWLVAHDVNEGREALNFSEWGAYTPEKRNKLLKEVCENVSEGEMPPAQYTLVHQHARLTKSDAQSICSWTGQVPEQEALADDDD